MGGWTDGWIDQAARMWGTKALERTVSSCILLFTFGHCPTLGRKQRPVLSSRENSGAFYQCHRAKDVGIRAWVRRRIQDLKGQDERKGWGTQIWAQSTTKHWKSRNQTVTPSHETSITQNRTVFLRQLQSFKQNSLDKKTICFLQLLSWIIEILVA